MRDAIVAVRPQPFDAGKLGKPARGTAPGKDGNKVDSLGDQRTRDRDDSLLDELFKATKRADAGAGVNGADPAGMARAPCFEQVEGFRSAHLPNRDAVGAQAQRGPHKVRQAGDAILGAQRHQIGRGTLQLAGVFDDDDTIRALGDLRQKGIGERGLAGEVPPATKILARAATASRSVSA